MSRSDRSAAPPAAFSPSPAPAAAVAAESFEPGRPALLALGACVLAALALCWPMLGGAFLLGDDQYVSGYAFRSFGAEYFRAHGRIPEWNPYLFGGLPFIAAQHGDVFYPTAWLRWVLPVDVAMNLGFALHLVLAGWAMYGLLRALRVGWSGALLGGIAYELTGIVATLVKPGHDGKLFVSALAPLAFLALVRAVRDRAAWGYGLLALVIGLCLLSPHYQMTYYLLVALAIWTLYLARWDPERPAGLRWPIPLALALGAVLLGAALAAIQLVPFVRYIPYSPRAAGGPSGGWPYATAFSMPPEEIVTTVLPQFNGVLERYWGRNFFKLHSEYLGAGALVLAALPWGDPKRRALLRVTAGLAALFLLIAFGGHTPFYRLWYEVMPMMKKVRAPGMAFYLVALMVAVWAGLGADRLFRGDASRRRLVVALSILGGIAVLGAIGVLQNVALLLAEPEQTERVAANGPALRLGSLRLLVAVAVGAAALLAVARGRLRDRLATGVVALVLAGDLWSIDRIFFQYRPPAAETFRADALVNRIRQERGPFRVLDTGVYPGSYLMVHDIPSVLGYHGNEIRFYDELLGGKNVWRNVGTPAVLDLVAARFLVLPEEQSLPGYHKVLGPLITNPGNPGVLYERDSAAAYARVLPAAAKIPDDQVVATVIDPRFPYDRIALYPDTAGLAAEPIRGGQVPAPAEVRPEVVEWAPGAIRIALSGAAPKPTYLVVSENWYPDWHATVDGRPAPVYRADHTFLSIVLPPGAREVRLRFASADYRRGQLVSAAALLGTLIFLAAPAWRGRRGGG